MEVIKSEVKNLTDSDFVREEQHPDLVANIVPVPKKNEKEVYPDSSSETSSWDSDVSVDNIFKSLSVNIVSTSHYEEDREDTFESEELIQSDTNS